MKANKANGITLIALVITIIVLLILAGVAIATLTGENGVLTKAVSAKEKTERAEVIENAKLDIIGIQSDRNGKLTTGDLKGVLDKYFKDVPEEDIATLELTTKDEKHKIKVSEIYNGKLVEASKSKTIADLYDGVNNPSDAGYKETGMHIGDYVDYTAGSWSETKAAPTSENPFEFGGYTAGQSRDTSATGGNVGSGYGYSGWRIWDISEDKQTMTLISAGCPEIYYHPRGTNSAYNTEKILTGETTGTIDESKPSTPRVWTDYINTAKYANNARAMKKSDLDVWYGKYMDSSITDSWDCVFFPGNAYNKLISTVENGYGY